jgi:hypothetical protein
MREFFRTQPVTLIQFAQAAALRRMNLGMRLAL